MADSGALALSTVSLVVSTYGLALPSLAETRGQVDDRGHLGASEKYAACLAGAVVIGVAGAARSPEAALAGVIAIIGVSAAYHFAVQADPLGG